MNKLALIIIFCAVLEILTFVFSFGQWSLFSHLANKNEQEDLN